MPRAFVAVGSNIEPARNVLQAARQLSTRTNVTGVSTVYQTAALGRPEQADYYNCVIEVETSLSPTELKHALGRIERNLGRRRTADKWAARTIDLDLIAYDDLVISTPELTIPDPDILTRAFLAAAVCELAPAMVWPGSGRTVSAVAASAANAAMLRALHEYTATLRAAVQDSRQCLRGANCDRGADVAGHDSGSEPRRSGRE